MEISSISQWSDHWLYCKHSYIICNHFIVIITLYQVYYNNSVLSVSTSNCHISNISCSATINNLVPFTPYIIEVSCSTGAGEGPNTNFSGVLILPLEVSSFKCMGLRTKLSLSIELLKSSILLLNVIQ